MSGYVVRVLYAILYLNLITALCKKGIFVIALVVISSVLQVKRGGPREVK